MKRLYVIVGPTAVGKTAAAIKLALHLNTEIVSCDSRQFYRELNIGVARPSLEELASVKHHFIANRPVTQPYNIFDYEQEALQLLKQLFLTHDCVVSAGGSGLYVDALCRGVNLLPDPSPEIRQKLSQMVADGRLSEMLDELHSRDPEYYAVVDRNNPMRVQRALETIIASGGIPYSRLINQRHSERPFQIVKIGLYCSRETLRSRIDKRVEMMMQQGLLDEATSLLPFRHLNTLNTVGYKEIFDHIDGKTTLDQAIVEIKNHTWQYAKKQQTWFKRYDEISWVEREFFLKNYASFLK